jgi:fucose permease
VEFQKGPHRALPLYVAFAATGVGVALPGVILPLLLVKWQLKDGQGGTLLLLSWFGSSIANLLIRGSLRTTLAVGSLLTAASALGLAELSLRQFPWLMAIYGLGLGLAMTSINLVRQKQASEPKRELIRLNLIWALGALACPFLASRVLQSGNMRPLLLGLGALFLIFGVWTLTRRDIRVDVPALAAGRQRRPWDGFTAVPFGLLMMVFLVTGIEAATSGWLSTYASRANRELIVTVAAPASLWTGLLISRMFWSLPRTKLGGSRVILGNLGVVAASAILLVASGGGMLMLLAAFGIGIGLGPAFPILIAESLRYGESGVAFLFAGLGASALPWLTGVFSQSLGSLRNGLVVPMAAALLLFILAIANSRRNRIVDAKPQRPAM